MAIPITDHPRYGEAMATYQQAKQAAAESGDPQQITKVELDWSNTKILFQNEMFDRSQAETARAAAVAQAKQLVPEIPDAVLAPLTTPEQILETANALKTQADARAAATTPPAGQQPPAAQSWGSGAPTGAPATPQDPNDPAKFHEHMFELAETIETSAGSKPRAVEEFKERYFDAFIKPGMVRPQR